MERTFSELLQTEGFVEAIMDTPISWFSSLIVKSASSEILFLSSGRPHLRWARRRAERHGHQEVMCHPQLWKYVSHPFSLFECVQVRTNISNPLILLSEDVEAGSVAHYLYHRWIDRVIPPERLLKLCAWDPLAYNCSKSEASKIMSESITLFLDGHRVKIPGNRTMTS